MVTWLGVPGHEKLPWDLPVHHLHPGAEIMGLIRVMLSTAMSPVASVRVIQLLLTTASY